MSLLPIITRELRAEARRPFTYWLRVLGMSVALLQAAIQIPLRGLAIRQGAMFLCQMQACLFLAIWVLVPLVTADCISRERREGTLGLLFLTPLKARDIVVAKTFAHGLRALSLCLAALPALALPLLMGGVAWFDVVVSLLTLASAFCWALAAGLMASAVSKVWTRAMIGAGLRAFGMFVLFCYLGLAVVWAGAGTTLPSRGWPNGESLEDILWLGFWQGFQWAIGACHLVYPQLLGGPAVLPAVLLSTWSRVTLLSLLVLLGAVLRAARWVQRGWQDQPPSRLRLWWDQTFCTPVFWTGLLRWLLRRRLEKNPIGWLVQRRWSGRLLAWGWLAVVISHASVVLGSPWQQETLFGGWFDLLAVLILISMAVTTAGSFRQERETGVLELVLVTPLRVQDILGGRLRGIWGQFLPAFALLVGCKLYLAMAIPGRPFPVEVLLYTVAFLTVPIIGLYCALRFRNFMSALAGTVLLAWLVPSVMPILVQLARKAWLGANFLRWQFYLDWGEDPPRFWLPATQVVLALVCGACLYLNLQRRRFALGQGSA